MHRVAMVALVGSLSACTFGSPGGGMASGGSQEAGEDGDGTSTTSASSDATSGDPASTSDPAPSSDGSGSAPEACSDGWWDDAWRARVPLSVPAGAVDSDLEDVPVLVVLDPGRLDYARVADGGADLRFVDAEGTILAHEIEHWDPAGTSWLWVRVPLLSGSDATDLWLYHDGPTDGDAPPPTDAWSDAHAGVWHFASPEVIDSSASAIAATVEGTMSTEGRIGRALGLPGAGLHRVTMDAASETLLSGWDELTLSLWVLPDYPDDATWESAGQAPWVSKGGPLTNGRAWREGWQDAGIGHVQIDLHFSGGQSAFRRIQIPRAGWTHVAYTFDGETVRLYRDGELYDTHDLGAPATLDTGGGPLVLGHDGNPMQGAIDELRIESVARPHAWMRAQAVSMKDALWQYGPAETCG